MITGEYKATEDLDGTWELKGLSSDTKPTETFKGIKLNNGSAFFEIDTKDIYFYDEAGKVWH